MNFTPLFFLLVFIGVNIPGKAQSCFNGGAETDLHISGLKGKVKKVREYEYDGDVHFNLFTSRKSDVVYYHVTFYNELGYEAMEKENADGYGNRNVTTYTVASSGKEVFVVETNKAGDTLSFWDYFYDNNCLLVNEVYYDHDFHLNENVVRTYDSLRRLTSNTTFDSLGKRKDRTEFLYDKDSVQNSTILYDESDSLEWKAVSTFSADKKSEWCTFYHSRPSDDFLTFDSTNEHGDLVVENFYDLDRTFNFGSNYTYVYDRHGNWIKRTQIESGDNNGVFITRRKIKYWK
ncbi:MAG TPA: hypothetical protein VL651_16670 [Bacteroidia bacterium]|jgi:hypothetical protein|nr:hypothetical protein [Bacteroidia bacterium]